MYFDHLAIQEGLSHNTVYCLLQDRHGYIWIGTQNGLNKYDGYTLEVYRSGSQETGKTGFAGRNISALLEDRQGNLWVGTRKNGINFRESSSDKFVNLQLASPFAAIKGYDVSTLFEDRAGNIWITTVGAGLLKYNPRSGEARHFTTENSKLSSNLAFDLVEDKYGTIWVAAAGGGLNYLQYNGQFALSHPMLPDNPNMSGYRKKLLLDDEYLWIGTEGTGLYRMHLKSRTYTRFAPGMGENAIASNAVRDMLKTKEGLLFIATDGAGLNIYNPSTGEISRVTYQVNKNTGLNSNALLCLWEGRAGNVWIGSYNGGVNIYKPDKTWFETFLPTVSPIDKLEHRSILSVFQSSDGKIWVGTDGGGLSWLEPGNRRFSAPSFKQDPSNARSISGNVVKTLFEDSQNRLWIGVYGGGLDIYNPDTRSFRHFSQDGNVWSIAEGKEGRIWLATMGEGLKAIDPETGQAKTFRHDPARPESLASNHIMAILADKQGQFWIGTADHGLDRWDEAMSRFVHYRYNPLDTSSLSNDEVRALFEDSRGHIWAGTEGGGLNRWLGNGKFERISVEDGLIVNSVMGITEDEEGMIWVATFEGVSRLNPETKTIRNFNFRTSQNANQFNQMAVLKAASGKLFFGGINGLNAIWPEQVREKRSPSPLLFTDFKIFKKSVPVGKTLDGRVILERPIEEAQIVRLNYADHSFSIEFTAIDFISPEENTFVYKMENFDEQWRHTAPGQYSVNYTNLDPGRYTFRLRRQGEEARLDIYIKPPFWKTLWFRLLLFSFVIGLLVLGVFLFFRRREAAHRRQLLQLRTEKLSTEVEAKNSKLMFSAVQMAHKNEILAGLKKEMQELEEAPSARLRKLVRKLDRELMSEDYWEEFNVYFNQVDQEFLQAMLEKHPELTPNDLRMCALLRIKLSTKEIASLLNISNRGVEQGRYRLKKRLGLSSEDSLDKYITLFNR